MVQITTTLRTLALALLCAGVMTAASPDVHAQASAPEAPAPVTTPAQDGFVPIDELPPEDRLPAAPFLVGAYTVTLVLLAGYVWLLWRKLGTVQRELHDARRPSRPGGLPM